MDDEIDFRYDDPYDSSWRAEAAEGQGIPDEICDEEESSEAPASTCEDLAVQHLTPSPSSTP